MIHRSPGWVIGARRAARAPRRVCKAALRWRSAGQARRGQSPAGRGRTRGRRARRSPGRAARRPGGLLGCAVVGQAQRSAPGLVPGGAQTMYRHLLKAELAGGKQARVAGDDRGPGRVDQDGLSASRTRRCWRRPWPPPGCRRCGGLRWWGWGARWPTARCGESGRWRARCVHGGLLVGLIFPEKAIMLVVLYSYWRRSSEETGPCPKTPTARCEQGYAESWTQTAARRTSCVRTTCSGASAAPGERGSRKSAARRETTASGRMRSSQGCDGAGRGHLRDLPADRRAEALAQIVAIRLDWLLPAMAVFASATSAGAI